MIFFSFVSGAVLQCSHRGSTVWCSEESRETGGGPPCSAKWSKNTTIPLFSCLDVPSEQQLVIKLTSQQARALAQASHSIVVHSGGNSFFHGIPGQKAGLAQSRPAVLALKNGNSRSATVLVLPRQSVERTTF